MKRTLPLVEMVGVEEFRVVRKITCRVTGQMADGTMVWTDENDEQYFCFKVARHYCFFHI